MTTLAEMKCEQDVGRLFVLEEEEAGELLKQLWQWRIEDDKLVKDFVFADFVGGLAFANKVTKIAEQEKYFPKFNMEQGKVTVTLFTESVGGLIKNDFIMAAKIDGMAKK